MYDEIRLTGRRAESTVVHLQARQPPVAPVRRSRVGSAGRTGRGAIVLIAMALIALIWILAFHAVGT